MPIEINQVAIRVDPPTITLVGQRVRGTELIGGAGNFGGGEDTETITTLEETIESTLAIRKREVLTFRGDVVVTITPDPTYTAKSYSNRSSTDIIGSTAPTINNVAQESETYYTLNGKDPVRTKANLYTGAFTLRRNESGTDNTIIKAKTFVEGKDSPVMKSEIRLIKINSKRV